MAAITEELPEQTLSPGRPAGLTRRDLWPGGRSGRNQRTKNSLAACLQRAHPQDPRETRLWAELLKTVTKGLGADEIAVVAAGLKISHLQEAGLERYVIRLATNFTARRNFLLEPVRGRKPKYGALVRPLSRNHKDKTIEATVPDEAYSWVKEGRTFRVEIWHQLVLNKTRPNAKNKTGDVYAFYDPDFDPPGLLATSVALTAESVRAIYPDRWPVEQIPLSAKQMVAAHRQFVHNSESIQRLPELALLAGSILSFLAATIPARPTGFWDRKPRRTPGRPRRTLLGKPFPKDAEISGQLREKKSVTTHLPKENLARQLKNAKPTLFSTPLTL